MLLRMLRRRIVSGLVARGIPEADAEREVGSLGDGTILKWLLDHGPDIIHLIESLVVLFAAGKASAPAA